MPKESLHTRNSKGQAFVEFTVALIIFVVLFVSVVLFRRVCVVSEAMRCEVRAEAGVAALQAVPIGWSPNDNISQAETRSDIFHKINAKNYLHELRSSLDSHVQTSAYTLAQRTFVLQEFNVTEVKAVEEIPLDKTFIDLVYGKDTIRVEEKASFPGLSNLY